MSPIAASSSRSTVSSGASAQAQGTKSSTSPTDQGFNALLQSGMLQPPQPTPTPSEPPKAVIAGSNNPQAEPGVGSIAPAASQTSSSEGVIQSQSHQAHQVNETASANSHGAKGSEVGLHLGEILQSLVDQGPANSSSKATSAVTGNTVTGNTATGSNQQGATAAVASPATTEPGAQVKSAAVKASLSSTIEELKATFTPSASAQQNSPESGIPASTTPATPASDTSSAPNGTKTSMQNAAATLDATQVQTSQLTSSQILDPTIKPPSSTSNLVGEASSNPSVKLAQDNQSATISSLESSGSTPTARPVTPSASGIKFLLPEDLRAASQASESSKAASNINVGASSMVASVNHPAQQFDVISLVGSAQGLDRVATDLSNFVLKEVNPITELPKVTVMTLEPRDLGTIVVKMTMDGSALQMELGVSNPHVSAMLNSSLSQLKEAISTASGMSVHIGFSSNPNLSGQGRQASQSPQGTSSPGSYLGDPKPIAPTLWPAQQPVASSGSHRLDRRI